LRRLNITLHGLDIVPTVPIGGGLYLPHTVGTVVMAQSIGRNVTLVSNVTIGMRHQAAFPIIGNDVYIGAGARVLGPITVGDGAVIGANAVVLCDVPPHATAVGVPARIIQRDGGSGQ
jgi:serine O-acetyltransferase